VILRSRRALAWRLAAVGIALGIVVASQVGRNGCLRHGASGAAIAVATASIDATPVEHGADGAHAACPLCTAAPIGPYAAPDSAPAPAPAIEVEAGDTPYLAAAHAAASPLEYAPKTSPPVA
jgi:hypothetical protein